MGYRGGQRGWEESIRGNLSKHVDYIYWVEWSTWNTEHYT